VAVNFEIVVCVAGQDISRKTVFYENNGNTRHMLAGIIEVQIIQLYNKCTTEHVN